MPFKKETLTLDNIKIGVRVKMNDVGSSHSRSGVAGKEGIVVSFAYWKGISALQAEANSLDFNDTFDFQYKNKNQWAAQILGFRTGKLKYDGIYPSSDYEVWIKQGFYGIFIPDGYQITNSTGTYTSYYYTATLYNPGDSFGSEADILIPIPEVPSWNPYSIKTIKNNYIPPSSGPAGMRLYLNNNRYSTTGAAKGSVGLSAAASRAINRNNGNFKINYNN